MVVTGSSTGSGEERRSENQIESISVRSHRSTSFQTRSAPSGPAGHGPGITPIRNLTCMVRKASGLGHARGRQRPSRGARARIVPRSEARQGGAARRRSELVTAGARREADPLLCEGDLEAHRRPAHCPLVLSDAVQRTVVEKVERLLTPPGVLLLTRLTQRERLP